MLSHYNILSIASAALQCVGIYPEDEFLSFLPLSHTLERTAGYYLPMMAGSSVTFSRSVAQLADDLARTRPTLLISVPRIFERVYERMQQQLATAPAIRRAIFNQAIASGWHHFERQQGRAKWHPRLLLLPLLDRLVGSKLRARLGGRLRLAVCGGAALPPTIAKTFIGLGVPLLQGYGLTETSPVISVNLPENNQPASIGLPLPGVKVRLGENSELQATSPGVMLGYWNNPAASAAIMTSDGWLRSGDQARIEPSGHIYLTGRLKDILVLSNGEKVPPGDMEMAICLDPLFEQALVIGEGQPFLAAIIVLNPESWQRLAAELALDADATASLSDKRVNQAIQNRIKALLHDFPGYAKIRRIHLTLEPWTGDNGLLTPTMKVKRNAVLERYAAAVATLFKDD
jgi:long-chain acyl-CoA synthetase